MTNVNLNPSNPIRTQVTPEPGAHDDLVNLNRGRRDDDLPPLNARRETPSDSGPQLSPPRLGDFRVAAVNIQQIAQLIQDQNLQSRETARQDRQQARDADIAAQQKAADLIREAAIFSLVGTVVSSALSIAGGIAQMRGAATAMKLQKSAATDLFMDKVQAKAVEMKASSHIQIGQAWGQLLSSSGQIAGAGLNLGTAFTEAKKAEQQAESTKMRSRAEDETDFIRAYQENVRAVQEKLAALQQAEADTSRQILRG
jgi:hypothetical protein